MPEEYTLQPPPQQSPVEQEKKPFPLKLIMGGVAGLVVLTLVIGIGLGIFLAKPQPQQQITTPSPTPTIEGVLSPNLSPTPISEIPAIKFIAGKQYFDDTYVVMEQKAPFRVLLLSVARVEQEKGFAEYIKVNFFNGASWDRKTVTATQQTREITTNPLLREWNETEKITNSSTVQLAKIELPQTSISFTSRNLTNEISIQSQPGATKFIYQGKGTITINNDSMDAYVYRSRMYSFNAGDLEFLTKPETLTSHWMVFWDTEGGFYYLDTHHIPNPTSPVQTLQIGVVEDVSKKVSRTTQLTTSTTPEKDFQFYQAILKSPIEERVNIPLQNTINKSPIKSYIWNLASGQGQVIKSEGRTVQGLGVVEYIKPQ